MPARQPTTKPAWLAPIEDKAKLLRFSAAEEENPAKAREVLSRLMSDERMKSVWKVLYTKSHLTGEYKYRGRVTSASIATDLRQRARELRREGPFINEREARTLEFEANLTEKIEDLPTDPRWSEQDRAAQILLFHIYKNALNTSPLFRADFEAKCKKLREISKSLQIHAKVLYSFKLHENAAVLEKIAANCENEARLNDPGTFDDDPGIINRRSGDDHLRTFINALSFITLLIFRNHLYSSLAKIANVVFERDDVTKEKVREMLRL